MKTILLFTLLTIGLFGQETPQNKMVNGVLVPLTDEEKQRIATENAAAQAALDIVNARKVWLNKALFWAEFTEAEKVSILTSENAGVKVLYSDLTMWSGEVWSDDAKIVQGLSGLVALGILTEERKTLILSK